MWLAPPHMLAKRVAAPRRRLCPPLPTRPSRQFAYKAGSGEGPRAWSKYTEGTSAHKRLAAPDKTGANAQPLGAGAGGAAAAGGQQQGKKGKKGSKEPLPEEGEPACWALVDLRYRCNCSASALRAMCRVPAGAA